MPRDEHRLLNHDVSFLEEAANTGIELIRLEQLGTEKAREVMIAMSRLQATLLFGVIGGLLKNNTEGLREHLARHGIPREPEECETMRAFLKDLWHSLVEDPPERFAHLIPDRTS